MSWFKGKDDGRYMAIRDAEDRACKKQDEKKADRMADKREDLVKNGDVSKAAKFW